MSIIKLGSIVSALVLAMAGASVHAAPTYGVDFTGIGVQTGSSVWSLGYKFIANNNVTVTGLGTFDYQQDGFSSDQQVGLWDSAGTLLASTFVTNSDPLNGFWRFHSISGVNLTAGATYYVASQGGEGYSFNNSGFTVDPNITFVKDAGHYVGSSSNDPLAFPDSTNGLTAADGGAFFGGNIELDGRSTDVPEPMTLSLVALGLAAVGVSRRRRG